MLYYAVIGELLTKGKVHFAVQYLQVTPDSCLDTFHLILQVFNPVLFTELLHVFTALQMEDNKQDTPNNNFYNKVVAYTYYYD